MHIFPQFLAAVKMYCKYTVLGQQEITAHNLDTDVVTGRISIKQLKIQQIN